MNKLAAQFPNIRIGAFFSSPDHNKFVYSADIIGNEKYSISIKDLRTGAEKKDIVHDTRGAIVWARNSRGFFYTKLDEQERATKVYYHELNTNELEDKFIYSEEDTKLLVNISSTSDHKYLVINSYNNSENEIRIVGIEGKEFIDSKLILPRQNGQKYVVDHAHDAFYLKINDKGPNFRLVRLKCGSFCDLDDGHCIEEVIPHESNQELGNFSFSQEYLVINVKSGMTNEIIVLNKQGISKKIKFDEEIYTADAWFPTYDSKFLRINYESPLSPWSVLEYDYEQDKLVTRYTEKTPKHFDKSKYKSERIYIKADDGVEIPISLFYRIDKFKKDGTNPVFLYGYGSYGISKVPYFNTDILPLVDRGFVYAMAHVRGGGELGEKWYEDAKLLTKKRTFNDYINCAEALIKRKYIDAKKIVGYGASAGGMLIGYVINEKPKLLKVAVTEVPFTGILSFMLDETLPGSPFHYSELGNPKEKKYYDYIKSYCPYTNIKHQNYPAVYATTGLFDSRVTYWDPLKWVAKLREYNQSQAPIMIDISQSGHFGSAEKGEYLRQRARMYNFILSNLDMSTR